MGKRLDVSTPAERAGGSKKTEKNEKHAEKWIGKHLFIHVDHFTKPIML